MTFQLNHMHVSWPGKCHLNIYKNLKVFGIEYIEGVPLDNVLLHFYDQALNSNTTMTSSYGLRLKIQEIFLVKGFWWCYIFWKQS